MRLDASGATEEGETETYTKREQLHIRILVIQPTLEYTSGILGRNGL
jgi:hypothetical protein